MDRHRWPCRRRVLPKSIGLLGDTRQNGKCGGRASWLGATSGEARHGGRDGGREVRVGGGGRGGERERESSKKVGRSTVQVVVLV